MQRTLRLLRKSCSPESSALKTSICGIVAAWHTLVAAAEGATPAYGDLKLDYARDTLGDTVAHCELVPLHVAESVEARSRR